MSDTSVATPLPLGHVITHQFAEDLPGQFAAAATPVYRTSPSPYATSAVLATTISAASNAAALPQAVINLASVTGVTAGGGLAQVTIGTTVANVAFAAVAALTLTGCTGGTGTLLTGQAVNVFLATPTTTLPTTGAVAANDVWEETVVNSTTIEYLLLAKTGVAFYQPG